MAANEPYSLKYTGQEIDDLLDVVNDLGPASTTTPGLMSASDKIKLDDIEPEAEENVIDEVQLGGTALTVQDKTVNIPLDSAPASGSNNPVKSGGVYNALAGIIEKIPSEASASNKLADKDYVDESVSTSSATYISNNGQPFASLADLQAYTGAHDKNDYAYVVGTDAAGNTVYYRYKFDGTNWAFEYAINNTAFTTSQWNTINSGMVAADKTKLDALPNNETLQEDLDEKAKKVSGATAGNFAALDGNGNLVDSGKKEADFYADGQVVPFAEGLVDTRSAGTAQEFTYRKSGGDGVNWMRRIKGKSLTWNQIIRNGNFAGGSSTEWANITSVTDGVANMVSTATGTAITINATQSNKPYVAGHKYLFLLSVKSNNSVTKINLVPSGSGSQGSSGYIVYNAWTRLSYMWTCPASFDTSFQVRGYNDNDPDTDVNFSFTNVIGIDLTLLFGEGKEPSTVEEFEALYNEPYYPYQPGIIKNNDAVAMESVGFNQWDEEWENGSINAATGADMSGASIRSKNYIPASPSTNYYFRLLNVDGKMIFYDAEKNYISGIDGFRGEFSTPAGCAFLRFATYSNYGTPYNHDICINLSDASRNGTYEPYWKKSIQLGLNAFRVTDGTNIITVNGLKSAGDVFDEIDPVRKKYIKRIGEVDLGTLDYELLSGTVFRSVAELPAKDKGTYVLVNAINPKYKQKRRDVSYLNLTDKQYKFDSGNMKMYFNDAVSSSTSQFKSNNTGVIFYYELATPVEYDLVDDIPNAIEVDENGTERAIFPEAVDPSAPFCSDSNYSVSIRKLTAFINSQNS